jgi:hypothetical protein
MKNEVARCEKIKTLLQDINLRLINPIPIFDTWFYLKFYKKVPKERVHAFIVTYKDYNKVLSRPHRELSESYLRGVRYKNIDFILEYDGLRHEHLLTKCEYINRFVLINSTKMYELLVRGSKKSSSRIHLNQLSFYLLENLLRLNTK